MRLLHTADWHLGRVYHGVSLLEDQAAVLASHSNGGRASGGLEVGNLVLSPARVAELEQSLRAAHASYSSKNPMRPGLPLAEAATSLQVGVEVAAAIAGRLDDLRVAEGRLTGMAEADPELEAGWLQARARLQAEGMDAKRIVGRLLEEIEREEA